MEQLAARWAHNPKVASSSLAPATKKDIKELLPIFRWFHFMYNKKARLKYTLLFLHINNTQPHKGAVCCVDLFVEVLNTPDCQSFEHLLYSYHRFYIFIFAIAYFNMTICLFYYLSVVLLSKYTPLNTIVS